MASSLKMRNLSSRTRTALIAGLIVAFGAAVFLSSYWWVFLLVGALVVGVSFIVPKQQILIPQQELATRSKGGNVPTPQFVMPEKWNPEEIETQARTIRGDQSMVTAFVRSFVNRFVLGQDTRTAETRIEFLKTKFEELKLSKGIQELFDELGLREGNLENQRLAQKRDTLRIEVEIAELEKQKNEIRNPPKKEQPQPPKQTRPPEEIREENREKIMKDIRDYERRKREIQADTTLSEDSRRRQDNIIEKRIEQLHDELEKYI
jgi:hypothetical protein